MLPSEWKYAKPGSTPSPTSSRWKSSRTAFALSSSAGHGSLRPTRRSAAASALSVWYWSVTVHALHRRSRIEGSAGWNESFQSPWP